MLTLASMARNLAAAFLSGPWTSAELIQRGAAAWGGRRPWLRSLVERLLPLTDHEPNWRNWDTLAIIIQADFGFRQAWRRRSKAAKLKPPQWFWVRPAMAPAPGSAGTWLPPALPTAPELALWLGITMRELNWFADCHGREARVPPGPLRHYTYRCVPKQRGKYRLLEVPKIRLKTMQRRILHEILSAIPPHDAAHAYRQGRSITSFAEPHCQKRCVIRFDLIDFFPSIRSSRVHALFTTAGYAPEVARLLTGLCTNVVPADAWQALSTDVDPTVAWQQQARLRSPHLPQGAPTSPALANLAAYRLDARLTGLAQTLSATYTRYADDLAISGGAELERAAHRLQVHVARIALEEGFAVNTRKTRFMHASLRQQMVGIVINQRPNVPRAEYDRLKAILCNCIRHGPRSQNRAGHVDWRGHLLGLVAHVTMVHPERGRRLRALLDRIDWTR